MSESNLQSIKSTEALVRKAFNAGVPKEQLENFLTYQYIPLPWQLKFHAIAREADKENGPVDIGAGGARGPGKSHSIFAQLTLDDCQRVPGLKGLFLRQTGKSADESFQDLVDEVLKNKIWYKYNASRGILRFKNGSRVLLGGFEDEKDIDKYVGIQYDVMAIEERNQLTGEKVLRLKGSLRTTKPNWRARMYSSFNPGNVGHNDVKQTFIVPYQEKKEYKTRFIPSTYKDNPFLKPEYIEYLDSLPGALGKAWREGNFDTFEGQYFQEWDYNKHTIAPFAIPIGWKRYRAYDHGRDAPACCLWFAVDYDGRVWVYRELYATGLNVDECAIHTDTSQCSIECPRKGLANEINRLSEGETYEYSLADPAIFAAHGFVDKYGGQTIAETFARRGVLFFPASNSRVAGWTIMHQYLSHTESRIPNIIFSTVCVNAIRTIPTLVHDQTNGEDLNSDGEDHAADVVRYFLMSLHEKRTSAPLNDVQKKLKEMQQGTGQKDLNSVYYPQ